MAGGSRGVLITGSYQVTCKCVIGLNFLMSISAPSECWQGGEVVPLFLCRCTASEFSREIDLIAFFFVFLTFY